MSDFADGRLDDLLIRANLLAAQSQNLAAASAELVRQALHLARQRNRVESEASRPAASERPAVRGRRAR